MYMCFLKGQFSDILIQIINEITDCTAGKRLRLLEILWDKRVDYFIRNFNNKLKTINEFQGIDIELLNLIEYQENVFPGAWIGISPFTPYSDKLYISKEE